MAPDSNPSRIVWTYYTSTHGTGDPPVQVDDRGRHWRMARPNEVNGSMTCPGSLADIRDGFVWPR